jgi:glyoxylase-like metal-dependent hydrolase (beta-lactamase superfamily II)/rhodanese-related sulfurtransferase
MSKQINIETLQAWFSAQRPVTVLDVRDDASRSTWSIPESLHVDAYDALRDGRAGLLASVELPRDRPVVAVCNAGRLSRLAADVLTERGFDAWSLEGGMKAWSLAWNQADIPLPNESLRVIQLRRAGKGCLSYLVASAGEALVIDPSLSAHVYRQLVEREGWTLRHVVETHVHADHLSRGRALAAASGARLHLPRQRRVTFPFTPIDDGGHIVVGNRTITALHTPGHTDESTTYLMPGVAFTGDTLFVGGVGRPDLHAEGDEARRRARELFASLTTLATLSPDTLVLPGHTSEAIPFNRQPIATRMQDARAWLGPWLGTETAFVERLLASVPPPPPNFAAIVALNETGDEPGGDPADLEAGANRCAVA